VKAHLKKASISHLLFLRVGRPSGLYITAASGLGVFMAGIGASYVALSQLMEYSPSLSAASIAILGARALYFF